jgi:predicted nuclease of predicted toxin-antitoxin system
MQFGGAIGMKVLIDECAPRALKLALVAGGYECLTVQEAGWSGKENGELPALADASFDVLVTVDQNIRYQQKVTGRKIALVIVRAPSNRLVDLRPHFPACLVALQTIRPGTVVEVGSPS